jgi:hypothetical protein
MGTISGTMLKDIQNIIEHALILLNCTFLFIFIRSLRYSQTYRKFRLLVIHLHKLENMVCHSPIKKATCRIWIHEMFTYQKRMFKHELKYFNGHIIKTL